MACKFCGETMGWCDLPSCPRRGPEDPAKTPNSVLPPLGDGPRRTILVSVDVPANWTERMDMQWVLEREIHADRWSWQWAPETPNEQVQPRAERSEAK